MRSSDPMISKIHDLPVEVLSGIASYIDFEDILSLQQTSQKLRKATEAHTIWLKLAQEYSVQHFHIHHPELGALKDLGTGDLRDWIRRRLIVDHLWRAQSVQRRVRTLPNQGLVIPRLVPGGRWLLVGHAHGLLCYYDLDSEDLKCVDLVQPSDKNRSHQSIWGLELDMNQDAPGLVFRIVVYGIDHKSLSKTQSFHVWQVRLNPKDSRSLTAERLASFPAYFDDGGFGILSLKRHLLARAVTTRTNLTWIEIYWWKQCSSESVLRTAFPVAWIPDNIYVIGDDKILCITLPAIVELHSIPEPNYTHVEDTLTRAGSAPARNPVWSHTFSSSGRMYCSPLYCDGAAHRVVLSTNQGIWGLVFPGTEGDVPSIIQLSTFSNRRAICIPAIRKALALDGEGIFDLRIGYDWDGGKGSILPINGALKGSPYMAIQPEFDEESGRVVWRTREAITVVDLTMLAI